MATIVATSDRKLEPYGGVEGSPLMQYIRDDDPYVHMTQVPPGYEIGLHSHSEIEVTVILSGSARVGDRVVEAGSVLVIEANEEYELIAGDEEPLTFLVVRPRKARYKAS